MQDGEVWREQGAERDAVRFLTFIRFASFSGRSEMVTTSISSSVKDNKIQMV